MTPQTLEFPGRAARTPDTVGGHQRNPLAEIAQPPEWMREGACVGADPDMWFPPKHASNQTARHICSDCPVRLTCLRYSLDHNETGIWGGTTDYQRQQMKRHDTTAAATA